MERVLLQMPQIAMVRVLGMPCEKRGEMLVACIVSVDGRHVSTTAIRRHCSDRLSSYNTPREYVFVSALPIDPRGNTDQRALETLVADRINSAHL